MASRVPAGVSTSPTATSGTPLVHVRAVDGLVEVRRGEGVAVLRVGEALLAGDVILAGAAGRAVLGVSDFAEVTVDTATELAVDAIAGGLVRVELRRGRAQGLRREGSAPFRLAFANGQQELAILRGHVGLLRAAAQRLTLASLGQDSVVELAGRRLTIPEHHVVALGPNARDLVPRPAPLQLSLTLHQTKVLRPGDHELIIEGRAPVGVILVLNAREVPVNPSGEFVVTLPAHGVDRVDARLRDALGRTLARSLTVTRVSLDAPWKEPG